AGWAGEGRLFYAWSAGHLHVFDRARGHLARRSPFAARGVHCGDVSPDGRVLAVATPSTPGVRLFDFRTGLPRGEVPVPTGAYTLAWHPDGRVLAVGDSDRGVQL